MKRKHLLMLMVAMIIGLFSIAYAETVTIVSAAEENLSGAGENLSEAKLAVSEVPQAPKAVVAAPTPAAAPVAPPVSRGLPRKGELINWFKGGNEAFPAGQKITVVDVRTGKSFNAMRTYGHNHSDMETLTNEDTIKMKQIWGGTWSWERRPVIVICNGRNIAASAAGMPHAGLDNAATEAYVKGRSGGFGYGMNLDKVKNNGMDGHFDIHLLGSKTHSSNKIDSKHQANVRIAAGL
jgi:rhodanese-related sulfurtransferase